MMQDIETYNLPLLETDQAIVDVLAKSISARLENGIPKIWHRHPVWFTNETPIVGYSKQKQGVKWMYWSGSDFAEDRLHVREGKFMDAAIFYMHVSEINPIELDCWLIKSIKIQWDYKNLVKRKGKQEKLV